VATKTAVSNEGADQNSIIRDKGTITTKGRLNALKGMKGIFLLLGVV
jgi:hypothetical protein